MPTAALEPTRIQEGDFHSQHMCFSSNRIFWSKHKLLTAHSKQHSKQHYLTKPHNGLPLTPSALAITRCTMISVTVEVAQTLHNSNSPRGGLGWGGKSNAESPNEYHGDGSMGGKRLDSFRTETDEEGDSRKLCVRWRMLFMEKEILMGFSIIRFSQLKRSRTI